MTWRPTSAALATLRALPATDAPAGLKTLITTPENRAAFLALFVAAGEKATTCLLDFFTAQLRNAHTRRAYFVALESFDRFCRGIGVRDITQVRTIHVSAYVERLMQDRARPTVKQHLAAISRLFDWLVVGQILPLNPARVVRGPKHKVKKGKTPVLSEEEARALLRSIETTSLVGLRDRALIGVMTYAFARVGAAIKMCVEDCYVQGRRLWARLPEKGGKTNEMPCHHNLEEYLSEYLQAAGITEDKKGPLFRTTRGKTKTLTASAMTQPDVYRMIRRRAKAAGIKTLVSCHTFRGTGITNYLKNGGKLEIAQKMAGHESARTTGLYDRRNDEISLDEVERIAI